MAFGGFYKGERKKSKKNKEVKVKSFNSPIIQMPEIISKKKKQY